MPNYRGSMTDRAEMNCDTDPKSDPLSHLDHALKIIQEAKELWDKSDIPGARNRAADVKAEMDFFLNWSNQNTEDYVEVGGPK